MKKARLKVWIGLGAILVVALIIFGSVNLYQKLTDVADLKGQLAEQVPNDTNSNSEHVTEEDVESDSTNPANPANEAQAAERDVESKLTENTDNGDSSEEGSEGKESSSTDGSKPVQATQEQETGQADHVDKDKAKKEIDATITTDMQQLRSSCVAVTSRLSKQIAEEIQADNDATIKSISSKYLPSILEAEMECDNSFQQLLDKAVKAYETAGLAVESMPQWKKQYESAKQQAREKALQSITSS